MRKLTVILAAATFSTVAIAAPRVPVMVGGDADFDACGGTADVTGLDPKGDNFLAVRSGPGSKYPVLDKLKTGHDFMVCDGKGDWVGIVYGKRGKAVYCGVSSVQAEEAPYDGPCRSGWIHSKYMRPLAG